MLSPAHQKFAERIVAGDTPPKAYRKAYPKATAVTANGRGSKLAKKEHIKAEVTRLRQRIQEKAGGLVMTEVEKRLFLAAVVRTPIDDIDGKSPLCQSVKTSEGGIEYKMPDKLKAIALDNDLAGDGNLAGANAAIVTFAQRMAHIRSHKKQAK